MSVLDRSDLEASPLAVLHVIASELGLDGFRRLRKAQLIDAIVERQGGEPGGDAAETEDAVADAEPAAEADTDTDTETETETETERPRRRRRGGRGRGRRAPERDGEGDADAGRADERGEEVEEDARGRAVEGAVGLPGNGSGFVRGSPPDSSDEDGYIS